MRRKVGLIAGSVALGFSYTSVIVWNLMKQITPRPQWVDVVGPLLAVISVGLYVGFLVAVIILQRTAIRPREITRTHILLSGVCEVFVDAVERAEINHRVRLRQWEYEDAAEQASSKGDSTQAAPGKLRQIHAIEEDRTQTGPG